MEADSAVEASRSTQRVYLTDLPKEIQSAIVSNCTQLDLVCVSLVSKHFRDLAAAELYRSFHIVFPEEDDTASDTIEGLAKGLETFATSDYDYAKHLRSIIIDTVNGGDKGPYSYTHYLGNHAISKLLDPLLILTLRKAKGLEKLTWSINVELSRPVFKALHQIKTINHLHIRLHHGASMYEAPPPLPLYASSNSTGATASTSHLPIHGHSILHPGLSMPPPPPPGSIPPPASLPILSPIYSQHPPRARTSKSSTTSVSPPTLSGFKNLQSLSVLDIGDLEVITELKSCIRNSQGTLKELQLSFSTFLAQRAREPVTPEIDPDESDPEDEFQVMPVTAPPPLPSDDISGPAKIFRAKEERKTQEAVLGRVFDVEPYLITKPVSHMQGEDGKKKKSPPEQQESEPEETPSEKFMRSLGGISWMLQRELQGYESLTDAQQDILNTISRAAQTYLDSTKAEKDAKQKTTEGGSSSGGMNGGDNVGSGGVEGQQAESSLFRKKAPKPKENGQASIPDDIDVEAPPEEDNFVEDSAEADLTDDVNCTEATTSEENPTHVNGNANPVQDADIAVKESSPNVNSSIASLEAQRANFETLAKKLHFYEIQAEILHEDIKSVTTTAPDSMQKLKDAESKMQEFSNNIKDVRHEMTTVAAEIEDAEKQKAGATGTSDPSSLHSRINEYTRSTRGLSLEKLNIHLIPVRASVLSRAIDLRVLQSITLLNVGNQAPVWTLLARENLIQPLPLRSVFTDNVSLMFLDCLSQLPELHALYMMERQRKYTPEPFAPATVANIDDIRRLVLKKHLSSLKRLMIKNEESWRWDIDQKTALLLCRRGASLEELAVKMGIREVHTLLQHIQQLINLRALHVINLRNDDTCVWVMRETKRFIIDTLSHFPKLKIEWLAIDEDDHVERITRQKESAKTKKKKNKSTKNKGKAKVDDNWTSWLGGEQVPLVFPNTTPKTSTALSDSEEDDDEGGLGEATKIETHNVPFHMAEGVTIFQELHVHGRM